MREWYGKPIIVNSGYRCEALNKAIGGAKSSQHMLGEAADITVGSKEENEKLFDYIKDNLEFDQLINESDFSWVHVSYREGRLRKQVLELWKQSYAEDFTYWTINNTGITSTPKKIVIPAGTELKYIIAFRGFNSFTDGFHIKYTGNTVITYRYNKEDDITGSITINESGIYHLPASVRTQKNFGFYCNTQTTTEEATIEILPTSILKDFSGNGLDAYMYGFQGKLNSGVGIYSVDFTTYNNTGVLYIKLSTAA